MASREPSLYLPYVAYKNALQNPFRSSTGCLDAQFFAELIAVLSQAKSRYRCALYLTCTGSSCPGLTTPRITDVVAQTFGFGVGRVACIQAIPQSTLCPSAMTEGRRTNMTVRSSRQTLVTQAAATAGAPCGGVASVTQRSDRGYYYTVPSNSYRASGTDFSGPAAVAPHADFIAPPL